MLQGIAPFPAIFAALIIGTDRRIIRALRAHHALSADSAIPLSRRGVLWRWRVRRLTRRGALVGAPPDRVYLSETGWQAYRTSRRRRILIALAILLPIVIWSIWLSARS